MNVNGWTVENGRAVWTNGNWRDGQGGTHTVTILVTPPEDPLESPDETGAQDRAGMPGLPEPADLTVPVELRLRYSVDEEPRAAFNLIGEGLEVPMEEFARNNDPRGLAHAAGKLLAALGSNNPLPQATL